MEWISVKDRLPEESGEYLAHFKNGFVQLQNYYSDLERFGASSVTHWMPLPEPPTKTP